MRLIGCDLHAAQQTLAILDRDTGEVREAVVRHDGDQVRTFYTSLRPPVLVGLEATGSMWWFLQLLEESGLAPSSNACLQASSSARHTRPYLV